MALAMARRVADLPRPGGRVSGLRDDSRAVADLEQQVRAYVNAAGVEGLERVYDYKSLAGAAGRSPLWQMVQHVVTTPATIAAR